MTRAPTKTSYGIMRRQRLAMLVSFAVCQPAWATRRVAVIADGPAGGAWCSLLQDNGFVCSTFPGTEVPDSFAGFDVVIHASLIWGDPSGRLQDHVRSGKGLVLWGGSVIALGINEDPDVQALVGANRWTNGTRLLLTTTEDPILGDRPPGTIIGNCADSFCIAVEDTSGHAKAEVLALFEVQGNEIGLMRNIYDGGQVVYMGETIEPIGDFQADIIVSAVSVVGPPIPTVSHWGLAVMTLLLLSAGSIVLRRRVL